MDILYISILQLPLAAECRYWHQAQILAKKLFRISSFKISRIGDPFSNSTVQDSISAKVPSPSWSVALGEKN
ncbi:hypothetical protein [Candidatus Nitrosocosmicus sp. T]